MRIESGCPKGELIRAYLTALIVCGGSVYFFYDGFIGYPRENLEWAIENLPEEPETPPDIKPNITGATHITVEEKVKSGATPDEIIALIGAPSYQTAEQHWHIGPGGYIDLKIAGSKIVESSYVKADHSEAQLLLQKVLGLICLPIGLYLVFKAVKLAGLKIVLDDDGLSYSSQPTLRWDAMTGLNISNYASKAWVNVEHTGGGPVKLDGYRIDKFDELVKAICEKKGFESPFGSPGETDASA
jgi:hypothetical protein